LGSQQLTFPLLSPGKAGGIGVAISHIRASGSYIRGTNGHSNGLVPMLRNFNETARYVDQGGGKRKGSFAMCLGHFGMVDQGHQEGFCVPQDVMDFCYVSGLKSSPTLATLDSKFPLSNLSPRSVPA
jgi:hypothetical protein